jgi:hypothetical protein
MRQLRHLGGEAELFCQLRIERGDGGRGAVIGRREFGLRASGLDASELGALDFGVLPAFCDLVWSGD